MLLLCANTSRWFYYIARVARRFALVAQPSPIDLQLNDHPLTAAVGGFCFQRAN